MAAGNRSRGPVDILEGKMSKKFLDWFFCSTWREFFQTAVVAVGGAVIVYALIVFVLITLD